MSFESTKQRPNADSAGERNTITNEQDAGEHEASSTNATSSPVNTKDVTADKQRPTKEAETHDLNSTGLGEASGKEAKSPNQKKHPLENEAAAPSARESALSNKKMRVTTEYKDEQEASLRDEPDQPSKPEAVQDVTKGTYDALTDEQSFAASKKVFPEQLMDMLSNPNLQEAIRWMPGGESFVVDNEKIAAVVPTKSSSEGTSAISRRDSFRRKLNRWGFKRDNMGPKLPKHLAAYRHLLFKKDQPQLSKGMSGSVKKKESHNMPPHAYGNAPQFPMPAHTGGFNAGGLPPGQRFLSQAPFGPSSASLDHRSSLRQMLAGQQPQGFHSHLPRELQLSEGGGRISNEDPLAALAMAQRREAQLDRYLPSPSPLAGSLLPPLRGYAGQDSGLYRQDPSDLFMRTQYGIAPEQEVTSSRFRAGDMVVSVPTSFSSGGLGAMRPLSRAAGGPNNDMMSPGRQIDPTALLMRRRQQQALEEQEAELQRRNYLRQFALGQTDRYGRDDREKQQSHPWGNRGPPGPGS